MQQIFRKLKFKDLYSVNIMINKYLPETMRMVCLTSLFGLKPNFSFVSVSNDSITGYILAEKKEENIEIISLCVDRNCREKGLASRLIINIIQKGKDDSLDNIILYVRVKNIKAIRLYKKLGFVKKMYLKNFYAPNKPGYKMVLNLKKNM